MSPQEALNRAATLRDEAGKLSTECQAKNHKANILENWAVVMTAIGDMATADGDKEMLELLPESMRAPKG